MLTRARMLTASLIASVALSAAVPAASAQVFIQDGLVNVAVGEVNILNDAEIGVAAQLAATICGVKVGPVAVLGAAVDRSGATRTVCETDQGDVTITQNN